MNLLTDLDFYVSVDGNSNVSIGSNNGVDQGVSYVPGKISQAVSFTGSSTSNVRFVDSADFTFDMADFAFGFWVKRTITGAREILFGQIDSSGTTAMLSVLVDIDASNVLRFICGQAAALTINNSTGTIADTNWHYVVIERVAETINFYIDDIACGSSFFTGAINNVSTDFVLGNGGDLTNNPFTGSLDEFGIWKRSMSSLEKTQLYNNGEGLAYPFTAAAMNDSNFFAFF